MKKRNRAEIAVAAMSLAFLPLAGCGEDDADKHRDRNQTLHREDKTQIWLDQFSHDDPAQWLIKHQKYADAAAGDADIIRVSEILRSASRRFSESPRMIANRSLQIQAMLEATDERVSALTLIRDFETVVGDNKASPGFGNIGDYYVTLRKNGMTRHQALKELSQRYSSRLTTR